MPMPDRKHPFALLAAMLLCARLGPLRAGDLAKYIAIDSADTQRYATGFVRDDPEQYRAIEPVQQFRAFYAPSWDLASDLPPPGNQGKQASCVAWAVGYAARTYYLKHDYSADVTQAANILSPAFIFNSLRENRGDCSTGLAISDALKLLMASGGVPLNLLPYDPKRCLDLPAPEVLARQSERFRIKGYRRVEGRNEDDVKGQIYSGNPVIFAIDIPAGFERYRGGIIDSVEDRGPAYGHALVLIGYDDRKQAYHFVNSWGTRWGEQGYGWISYRSAAALWEAGYVMEVASPPAPAPAAASGPAPAPSAVPLVPPVPAPAPAPPPQPAQIDLAAPCSQLAARAHRTPQGDDFTLSGFVGSAQDLERIRVAALRRSDVRSVDAGAVALRPWPQCEALLTLAAPLRSAHGMLITQTPARSRLLKGEHMIFEVRSPDYPSYLYVAYLQADGTAAHLLRPSGGTLTPAATLVRLGDTPGAARFRVGPPYGHEMVIALAADHALLDEALLGPIRERQLLTAYRRALLPAAGQLASAAVLTVETAEE
jgi:hypothetical protein